MGLYDAYDPDRRAILSPGDVAEPIEGFPETVIVTFKPRIMDLALERCPHEVLAEIPVFFKMPIYRVELEGRPFGLYQTLMGGAVSAAMVEEVIARGAKKILLFGSCGSLSQDLPDGFLLVPTAAYRDEGVSYHYLPAGEDYVTLPTAEKTGTILTRLGIAHRQARTWTTDGLYRETRRNMDRRKGEGCLAVDMECASMAAVCQYRGVEFYQFLYTEDNLDGTHWDPRLLGKQPESADEGYWTIAAELAKMI